MNTCKTNIKNILGKGKNSTPVFFPPLVAPPVPASINHFFQKICVKHKENKKIHTAAKKRPAPPPGPPPHLVPKPCFDEAGFL